MIKVFTESFLVIDCAISRSKVELFKNKIFKQKLFFRKKNSELQIEFIRVFLNLKRFKVTFRMSNLCSSDNFDLSPLWLRSFSAFVTLTKVTSLIDDPLVDRCPKPTLLDTCIQFVWLLIALVFLCF
jgi:hypothetical protein